ncbi:MAG: peptidoglycan-N-acetylglucosamine deacetylase [Solirubrobacteraceae bacterium]|jgi:polysaccharide deacetylase family protein (PEP-CTERM system associated)|nr:peptidoglycan-N-acetylglucosamine deacetylase [Solirubrobacteraceae bacterium]
MPLTVTFDLEDNRRSSTQEARFVPMSERFLDFIELRGITATVFIVGEIARTHARVVRRVAEGGHEIGLHGLRHVALEEVGPDRLEGDLREGRELLEDLIQTPVEGFRAPIFSLTPATSWAVESIAAAGFTYSSSVLPAANPLHGWPGAPLRPFRWDNGLIELPCPVGGIGRARVPFLGGIYLRYVPMPLASRFLARLERQAITWSYSHPYDIDTDEPFFTMPYAGWLTSRILHTRRGATLPALDARIAASGGAGRPLRELAGQLVPPDLPVVRPR